MTVKLYCPFCGAELIPQNDIENTEPTRAKCGKLSCPWFMWVFPWEIWQALIDGKAAQDALKEIVNFFDTKCDKNDLYFYNLIEDNIAKYREIISITEDTDNDLGTTD